MNRRAPASRSVTGATISVFGAATGAAEIEELTPSVLDGWMGMGRKVAEFEVAFSARLGADFAMTDSGSNALQLAVAALDLPPGSDIVIPSFTWVACANAVVLEGHRPVFADVDVATGNINRATIEEAFTERTRAIMVVHYAGKPVDIQPILDLGLPVIEDAAHAVDSALDGKPCGTFGDLGVFSFDSVKNLATPDGGGVTSPRKNLMGRVRRLRYCGIGGSGFDRSRQSGRWWEQGTATPFPRAIPNDVSASIGLVQLGRLPENQHRRSQIWERYQRELEVIPWLSRPPDEGPHERHSFFTYLVRVTDGRRDELARHLLASGIYTTLRYQPLHLSSGDAPRRRLPGCETLAEEGLNLPLHPRLTDGDVERVLDALQEFR